MAAAAPAIATSADAAPDRFVSGPFTGTAVLDSAPDCAGTHTTQQYAYGVGQPPPASGTVQLRGCVLTGTFPFTVTGSFVLTAGNGAVLAGTLVGLATFQSFTNTYTVASGTKQFSNLTGTIDVTATVDFSTNPATVTGTYVPHLSH
jgi:hypothetical protein